MIYEIETQCCSKTLVGDFLFFFFFKIWDQLKKKKSKMQVRKIPSDLPFAVFSPIRLHGNEVRGRDAADVRSVLHPQVVWWRQTLLVCVLRVRQDHTEGVGAPS